MTCPGIATRQRYLERIKQVEVGASLERKGRVWSIVQARRTETGVLLHLQYARRLFRLYVPVTLWGPELWHSGFSSVSVPPAQRDMFGGGCA
jgi:hypothetical protein